MGLFGKNRDPLFGERIRAAIATMQGDTGASSRFAQLQQQNRAFQTQQAATQREQEVEGNRQAALQGRGYTKDQINALSASDASQLERERLTTRQFGPTGGTTRTIDPATGLPSYEQAPGRYEVNGNIIGVNPDQTTTPIYQGLENVVVPEGGEIATINRFTGREVTRPAGSLPPPQIPQITPPARPTGASVAPQQDAPAFAGAPDGTPPEAADPSFRGVVFGNPLAPQNMPNLSRGPRRRGPPSSAPRQPVRVRSAAEARALPRGTVFITPDGRRKVR